ncbi:bifunctional folylpolyglutamate synthase/dihydrofolate synthase [Thiomonas bhubaneswarensis]|uniref:Dihydrofolate synthase/folylpolyglutamate synthase n=1 Tax=Thiomonas bhubaneswarensis TaxID=339866 RepID=A0A0K6I462_9BURK|nr:folylpolyglutamate synthase/dihydrofolate synthase family protein [Thiomonas bhubaneswarensis]CUA97876.1 folylpolyglutamate synthase/dihydrofolate synthase [Thiomonas bhubaneswarensis]
MAPTPHTLDGWLSHAESIHARAIDMGLERVQRVREIMQLQFVCPVITVAGTNGKGSTCAMLEAILLAAGYRVGVYTSPHLVHFEERCRIDGQAVQAQDLLPHFAAVERARLTAGPGATAVSLSYFEFTTLAILSLLASERPEGRAAPSPPPEGVKETWDGLAFPCERLDAVILEVGLGGRLDAVNVIDTDCAILTSIDLDHMEYLGPDREAIGREKAGIMRSGKPAIVSDPQAPASVLAHAKAIGADLWLAGRDFHYTHLPQQWSWQGRAQRRHSLAFPALRGANQLLNASGVLAALEAMQASLPVAAQAVREGFARAELPGRFQVLAGQPTLVLDVGHNPHAIAVLAENLDSMGYFPVTHAVFGAMADKDIAGMLRRMLPLIDVWHLCDLPTPRAATAQQIAESLIALKPQARIVLHADPIQALEAAAAEAELADRIVVFGSFYTVGGVMQKGLPRLHGKHLESSPQ